MTGITDLIERLEKATGPDRLLDGDIAAALKLQPTGWRRGTHKTDKSIWWDREDKTGFTQWAAPRYTKSIDAAMTLVPEGMQWAVWGEDRPQARVYEAGENGGILIGRSWECCDAESPAIALCIAPLKALATPPAGETE